MIKKLKMHTVKEQRAALREEFGDISGELFGVLVNTPTLPTEREMMDKINEIIDYINKEVL